MNISDHDNIVGLLYKGVTSDRAFRPALEAIAERFGCRSAAMVYADRSLPCADLQIALGPFADTMVWERYCREFATEDPAPRAMAQLAIGQAAATDMLFSPELRQTMRFLNAFYYPIGLREALGGPIAVTRERTGIVAVHRGPDRRSFNPSEVDSFARILVHFARAFELREAFFRTMKRVEMLDEALDGVTTGVMSLDRQGMLSHANAAARDMLAAEDGLVLSRTGRLRALDTQADVALQSAITNASDRSTTIRLPRTGLHRQYVTRVRSDATRSRSGGQRCTLLFITNGEVDATDVVAQLQSGLGLTAASAALVGGLISGHDLQSYASSIGIKLRTAKFHLHNAFAATNTARQADLVRMATVLMKDLGSL